MRFSRTTGEMNVPTQKQRLQSPFEERLCKTPSDANSTVRDILPGSNQFSGMPDLTQSA
jgi:hypothetical protein